MSKRLRQGCYDSRYRLRQQNVEPVFGPIKQARGPRQFLPCGHDKAAGEWRLLWTLHNILEVGLQRLGRSGSVATLRLARSTSLSPLHPDPPCSGRF